MHTCSNDIPPMVPTACGPEPSPMIQLGSRVDEYLQQLLASITPDLLEENGRLRLVVANPTLASVVRGLLEVRGIDHVDVEVAAPVSTTPLQTVQGGRPTALAFPDAKKAYWDACQPRHKSPYTKSQPSTKARKAARKRAKAGRKAAR